MVLIDLQSSKAIKEHLDDLIESYSRSRQKERLRDFIAYWKVEYRKKVIAELNK